jgi:hypothetical protein
MLAACDELLHHSTSKAPKAWQQQQQRHSLQPLNVDA